MKSVQLELASVDREWINEAAAEVIKLLPSLGDFSTDDLHHLIRPPAEPNWWGCVTAKLRNQGFIEHSPSGYKTSLRPEANGRPIRVWRGK